jgi:bifunctional non-homologous end joining protein LigD
VPAAIHGVEIQEEKGSGIYVMIRDLAGLIALVQLGVLEMHPWGARADRVERPDRLVMDLDSGPGVTWKTLQEAAVEVRGVFEELGLESWLRTSGGKGLHIVAPFERRISWDDLKGFTRGISHLMARRNPSRYVATMSKAKRRGKIYVDYLRNSRGATAVASYSTRARAGATVATPLRWNELSRVDDPAMFNVESVPRRLASLKKDPWKGFLDTRQVITKGMMNAVKGEK